MLSGVAKSTAEWVKESSAVKSVMGGVHTILPGKKLLDEGGAAAELTVLALKVAIDAVAADAAVIEKIQSAIELYQDATSKLHAQISAKPEFAAFVETYKNRTSLLQQVQARLGDPPSEPPMTDIEREATTFVSWRLAKSQIGLRIHKVGSDTVATSGNERSDDSASRSSSGGWFPRCKEDTRPKESHSYQRLDTLLQELFRLQDLNGNGVLEEAELVKLNQKIAMLHYGKETDKHAVEEKFKDLFREKLDASGQAVPFPIFCKYMRNVLNDIDQDLRAQEMIAEQFIAEAEAARAAFHCKSFMSGTDAPYLPHIAYPEGMLPRHDAGQASAVEGGYASTALPTVHEVTL